MPRQSICNLREVCRYVGQLVGWSVGRVIDLRATARRIFISAIRLAKSGHLDMTDLFDTIRRERASYTAHDKRGQTSE